MGISDAHSRGRRTRRAEENALGTPNKRNRDSEDRSQLRDISLKTNIATSSGGYRQRTSRRTDDGDEDLRSVQNDSAEEPGELPSRPLVVHQVLPRHRQRLGLAS